MFCLARDVEGNPSGFYEYMRNKEGRKKNRVHKFPAKWGKRENEKIMDEADRTGAVNAAFVSVFTEQLIVIRCLMRLILIRG